MLRSNPGTLMQKTYDECYLMCSTAVYFEGQNNEQEALRSWRNSLDTIYRYNASLSSAYTPQNETERSLQRSIRGLEIQSKERIDLLEALRESRKTAELETVSTLGGKPELEGNSASTEPNGSVAASPRWIGNGTIPPLSYPDLPRPSLPPRPQINESSRGTSATSLPASSRVSSLEKRRLLPTLRGVKDKKSLSEMKNPPSRQGGGPAASQAAGLAWDSVSPRPLGLPVTQLSPGGELATRQSVDVGPRPEMPAKKESSTSNFAADAAAAVTRRSTELEHPSEATHPSTPPPRHPDTKDLSPAKTCGSKPGAPASAYPAYRKDFPESRNLSTAASTTIHRNKARSTSILHGLDEKSKDSSTSRATPPSRTKAVPKKSDRAHRSNAVENGERPAKPSPIKDSPTPSRKNAPHHSSRHAQSGYGSDDGDVFDEDMVLDKELLNILDKLPKSVNRAAARQILNEIIVRGDEVHWDDIAGLEAAKKALKEAVVYPFLRPDLFMGLREPARGMLLFGPPGTGKTMLARAVATESKSTFFSISATSLTSKWHGESEKLVRALFALAKAMAPSIIFVDEIDSLLSSRVTGEHDATRRSKTQFLVEWSDLQRAAAGREQSSKEKAEGDATRVLVLGATNMPWDIDDAARRRFVRRQYIPLPEAEVRKLQLQKLLSHQSHDLSEEDMETLVKVTEGFSGSDITSLAKDAAMGPLRNLGEALLSTPMDEICPIQFKDFKSSLCSIRSSISRERLKEYDKWAQEFGERGA
ncbi:hypothetical protein LOZ12_005662 [Ophidiomyces ophidiicola]|uniref:Uncharacterized protein n=1 Tax=Ophidiomyces ophidiicola TaxID=1387563 RepID=A0ACB8V1M4_9EURO|nr:hypothetical protein LOZ62_005818 [Ophidiomyces ophidiicola]KAI1962092.1 hypothetical protein LOZ59_002126 [Ophidiomyces ophidiicola]KAI1970788.1 hypothetical protein LOZ56_003434 [Ophidiomyces ophidiicola]KAI2029066.1 hypothetical protein LOZ45_002030 [Ophidiomyces ophidiicola]KAI2032823.1 hypothetical protein LOZ48_002296 [Ophidiomyces ophidiicola]